LTVVPTKGAADQAAAEDIVAALKRHALMVENADDITVSVEEGRVTLSGTVPSRSARKVAGIIASYTYGVIDVDNEVKVVAP
jgi:osmotically-inducible protein OsmY